MNILIYYHNDADGIVSALVVKNFISLQPKDALAKFTFVPVSHPFKVQAETILPTEYDQVYALDCFLGCEPTKLLVETFERDFIWIDHHKSSIKEWRAFSDIEVEGLQTTSNAACLLSWVYFNGKKTPPELVKHINDFDTWNITNDWETKAYPMQLLLSSTFSNLNEVNETKLFEDFSPYLNMGVFLMNHERASLLKVFKNAFVTELSTGDIKLKALFINYKLPNSYFLTQYVLKNSEDFDVVVTAVMTSKDYWKVSVYRHDNSLFDVTRITSLFEISGGHEAAGGFSCSTEQLTSLIAL